MTKEGIQQTQYVLKIFLLEKNTIKWKIVSPNSKLLHQFRTNN